MTGLVCGLEDKNSMLISSISTLLNSAFAPWGKGLMFACIHWWKTRENASFKLYIRNFSYPYSWLGGSKLPRVEFDKTLSVLNFFWFFCQQPSLALRSLVIFIRKNALSALENPLHLFSHVLGVYKQIGTPIREWVDRKNF